MPLENLVTASGSIQAELAYIVNSSYSLLKRIIRIAELDLKTNLLSRRYHRRRSHVRRVDCSRTSTIDMFTRIADSEEPPAKGRQASGSQCSFVGQKSLCLLHRARWQRTRIPKG